LTRHEDRLWSPTPERFPLIRAHASMTSPTIQRSSTTHRGLAQSLELLSQLARREIASRYRGAFLGIFASIINPLLMLIIYSIIFGEVFKARFHLKPNETAVDYVVGLFCGLVCFNYFAECLNRAPTLILAHPNYVKKVVFPIELIPLSVNFAALFHLLVSLVPLFFLIAVLGGGIHAGALWLIVFVIPLFLMAQGCLWILSALGVFIREIEIFLGPITQTLMFGSAVFYTIESIPEPYSRIIAWNPLAQIIEMSRTALLLGRGPQPVIFLAVLAFSAGFCAFGFRCFRLCRAGFADVI
jgi:lipopolysaccharide transport system permease protein